MRLLKEALLFFSFLPNQFFKNIFVSFLNKKLSGMNWVVAFFNMAKF